MRKQRLRLGRFTKTTEKEKEYALETVYNVYYDMYMSEAKAESKIVAKMKSSLASDYVRAVTKRKIITKEEAEKQREAAFEDVRKHMKK